VCECVSVSARASNKQEVCVPGTWVELGRRLLEETSLVLVGFCSNKSITHTG